MNKKYRLFFIITLLTQLNIFAQDQSLFFEYQEYYSPGVEGRRDPEQFRITFVWDSKSGKSARYFYDDKKWNKSSVLLPIDPLGNSSGENGEIMMDYHEYYSPGDPGRRAPEQYRIVFVWNSKTGESARYYYDNKAWHKSSVSLPEQPLGATSGESGEIMMDYHEYYSPGTPGRRAPEQFRIVYVWNTRTGESARFYYDNKAWYKSSVALPDSPLKRPSGEVGEIMMDYHEYYSPGTPGRRSPEQFRIVYVWNTRTGESARYYYDNKEWYKSSVALPEKPLKTASEEVGEIMMRYHEYYSPGTPGRRAPEQFRIVFVWNTKTGESARYYYDDKKWLDSSSSLPKVHFDDFSSNTGEILMNYREYYSPGTAGRRAPEQFRIVSVLNSRTGEAIRYYYDNGVWKKSSASFPNMSF
ncbi:MAG: hypothetical protein AAFQ94_06490 [Bacteroidota bacterium]